MDEQKNEAQVIGRLTYADLSNADLFFQPPASDAWGKMRIPFSPQLARMSAELAANVYDLAIHQWEKAGWMDCAFVIEDRIVELDRDSDSKLAAIEAEWKRYRAKSLIHGVRPIGDLVRAARQLIVTDMGKTVVMTRMHPEKGAIIAISFIGTTEKMFDWISNFKFRHNTGMHYGFMELARHFDMQSSRILFSSLAQALGEKTFTLADVLLEAQKPDSRFTFWISGHSQGGALVQTYTHLLLQKGIEAHRILAYSFAAPTVSVAGGVKAPDAYPIYNIINTDDLVTRVGAQIRLGVDCLYDPSDAFREEHYRIDEALRPAFQRIEYMANQIHTTQEAFCWGIALVRLMREVEIDPDLEAFFSESIPHLSMLHRLGFGTEGVTHYVLNKLAEHHRALTNENPAETLCDHYDEMLRVCIKEFGAQQTTHALGKYLLESHRIRPDKRDEDFVPSYIAIVRKHAHELATGIWNTARQLPRCENEKGEQLLPRHPQSALSIHSAPSFALPSDEKQQTENI